MGVVFFQAVCVDCATPAYTTFHLVCRVYDKGQNGVGIATIYVIEIRCTDKRV